MRNIVWLKEAEDELLVGKKSKALAQMFKAGFPIPPAFIITVDGIRQFFTETGIDRKIDQTLRSITWSDHNAVKYAVKQIQHSILQSDMPLPLMEEIDDAYDALSVAVSTDMSTAYELIKASRKALVAVRCSPAIESGLKLPTFLNVKDDLELIEAIKHSIAAFFDNMGEDKKIAILVQRMIDAEKSGIAYTSNPFTRNANEILIKALYGSSIGLITGKVEPDTYNINKATLQLASANLAEKNIGFVRDAVTNQTGPVKLLNPKKQVLDNLELEAIGKMLKKLEEFFDHDVEVEYAFSDDELYVVQVKPLHVERLPSMEKQEEIDEMLEVKKETPDTINIDAEQNQPEEPMAEEQEKAEPITPEQLLENANLMTAQAVIACDMAVTQKIKGEYESLIGPVPLKEFKDLIEDLKQNRQVPYEGEIQQIRSVRNSYVLDYQPINEDDVKFVLMFTKKFLDEF
jgi:pyruvate,water dikinase